MGAHGLDLASRALCLDLTHMQHVVRARLLPCLWHAVLTLAGLGYAPCRAPALACLGPAPCTQPTLGALGWVPFAAWVPNCMSSP